MALCGTHGRSVKASALRPIRTSLLTYPFPYWQKLARKSGTAAWTTSMR